MPFLGPQICRPYLPRCGKLIPLIPTNPRPTALQTHDRGRHFLTTWPVHRPSTIIPSEAGTAISHPARSGIIGTNIRSLTQRLVTAPTAPQGSLQRSPCPVDLSSGSRAFGVSGILVMSLAALVARVNYPRRQTRRSSYVK